MRYTAFIPFVLILGGASCGSTENNPSENNDTTGANANVAVAQTVVRTDIVSDVGATGVTTDPQLINAWGLAFNPMGPAWVSAAGSGVSEVYDITGKHVIPPVTIPACRAPTSSPTGQVFNTDTTAFMGDNFVFVTEQGTIAGWQPSLGSRAALRVGGQQCVNPDPNEAVYKGVTIAKDNTGKSRLYAANFHNGTVDVFDSGYAPFTTAGKFADPGLPAGFAPFNVQEVDGKVVVTYAKQDANKQNDVAGLGNGFVNVFDIDGNLLERVISGGELNSPWGVAKTPSNRLLVGNFGDGLIHEYAFDADAGIAKLQLLGVLAGANGQPLVIDGLWALRFGLNAGGFSSNVLYFTAGPGKEAHGVFGKLEGQVKAGSPPGTSPY